jgi:hypothetical protein
VAERSAGDEQRHAMETQHSEDQRLLTHRINQTISANRMRNSTPEAQVRISARPRASSGKAYYQILKIA